MKMSNASLLDESTAGAEAMSMCFSLKVRKEKADFDYLHYVSFLSYFIRV